MSSEPENILNQRVSLKLITPSLAIDRILQERVYLKIGRQVKTAQEKMLNQFLNDDQDLKPLTPINPVEAALDAKETDPVWFKSKVVSRSHAEIWLKDGQVYLRDAGSSSGTFLNKMRLSPANRISRPYPLRKGDVIQLGVDYQGRQEGNQVNLTAEIYQAVEMTVELDINPHHQLLSSQIPIRFKAALFLLLLATNPYSTSTQQTSDPKQDTSIDCCICISGIGPFQALFIAPCSHCFHYKCIQHILKESIMFPCPVCRQVANLEASVSMESVCEPMNVKQALTRSMESVMQIDETFSSEPQGFNVIGVSTDFGGSLESGLSPLTAEGRSSIDIPTNEDTEKSL